MAKLNYCIIDVLEYSDSVSEKLARKKLLSSIIIDDLVIFAKYGTDKKVLRKILKEYVKID